MYLSSAFTPDKRWTGFRDSNYIGPMFNQVISDRWISFMEYLSNASKFTSLADHVPAGFAPLTYSNQYSIDVASPLAHRETAKMSGPIEVSEANGVRFFVDEMILEPQKGVDVVTLQWTALASLATLGVKPKGVVNYSHSVDLYHDAVALNYDVSNMMYAASRFRDTYLFSSPSGGFTHPIGAASNTAKAEVIKEIYTGMTKLMPSASPYAGVLAAALSTPDLSQNKVWADSVFVDCPSTLRVYGGVQFTPTSHVSHYYRLSRDRAPFLVYRPFSCMPKHNRRYGIVGDKAHLMYYLDEICSVYRNHPLSTIDRSDSIVVNYTNTIVPSNEMRLRMVGGRGVSLPKLAGLPYTPEPYQGCPFTDTNYIRYRPQLSAYDCKTPLLFGDTAQDPEHYYRIFKRSISRGSPSQLNPHILEYTYSVEFKVASSLEDHNVGIKIPKIQAGVVEKLSAVAMLYPPKVYSNNPEGVLAKPDTPDSYLAVLPLNCGPYITRTARRTYNWPSNCNYVYPSALTENLQFGTTASTGTPDMTSLEFNLAPIGAVLSRRESVVFTEPSSFIKYIVDPMINIVSLT